MSLRSCTFVAAMFLLAGSGLAGTISFQGFESNAGDWSAENITRVASGAGTLGLTAAAGGYYAEIHNTPDGYQAGSGDAGYSRFGFSGTRPYEGDFYQSIDVYVDTRWTPAAGGIGMWLDMSPYSIPPGNYGAEHNFQLNATGSGTVDITVEHAPLTVITSSGWYTFEMAYRKGANPTDLVLTDLTVYNSAHSALGTMTKESVSPTGPLYSSDLGGPGYVWLTVWPNGYADNVVGIDNISSGFTATPEPATVVITAAGLLLVGCLRVRRCR